MTSLERALLRCLVMGCALQALQARVGISGLPRLLALAILNSWI